ncbi:retrovirus-related pol polyprotein from transposon RE2 [Tanacetum coccineum]
MDGAKPVATPLSSTESLFLVDGSPIIEPTPYRQLVGSLQYLAFTRPDVSYAVNKLSQYMHAPTQLHWQALKQVLRYLKAELSWVQNLLLELGLSVTKPPTLFCDNAGATYLCANPVYHSHMKHVALDYHFVREKVTNGSLRVLHIHSADQLADVLTEPLGRGPFLRLRSKIGASDGSSILRGHIKESTH